MTNQELIRHNNFLLKQIELTRKGIIQPIYRGDSLKNLCYKLNVTYEEEKTNFEILLARLFMVGEKSQRYYSDNENFRIENAENLVFERIYKYYQESLKNKNKDTLFFFERNKKFSEFFLKKENKKTFIDKINEAAKEDRINIRNYYLILLHQLAAINYKKKSHFVSTSKEYKIAEMFSNGKHEKDRIILHCWYPKRMVRSVVKKYYLPTYNFHPYQYQKEYSVLGGILPHYISGLEVTNSGEFYPNPNIFNQEITESTFLDGIKINQENFHEIANFTNYRKTLTTDGVNIWENEEPGGKKDL